METIDVANRERAPSTVPMTIMAPTAGGTPRCRRCGAVLVVAHLRCDDGALIPIYRCPLCRHAGPESYAKGYEFPASHTGWHRSTS